MLTGKCKEAFKEWYVQDEQLSILRRCGFTEFTTFPIQMQYGVYLDFFDSVGIELEIEKKWNNPFPWGINCIQNTTKYFCVGIPNKFETRQEAQIEAIKKANDIFNAR